LIKSSAFKEDSWNGTPSVLIAAGDGYQSTEVVKKAKAFLKKNNSNIIYEKFSTPDYQLSDALEQFKVFGLFGEQRCVEFNTDKELSSDKGNGFNEQGALLEMEGELENGNFLIIQLQKFHKSKWLEKIKKSFFYVDCALEKETRTSLKNWLLAESKERSLKLNSDGAFELIERIGLSRAFLEKALTLMELSIDASKQWDKKQVQSFFTEELENTVFKLTDALGNMDLKSSLHLLNWFQDRGMNAVELLGVLRNQFRKILVTKETGKDYCDRELIGILKSPEWLCKKLLSQAKKYNLQKLKKIYTELHYLDRDLKSLKLNQKDQFEMFILKLFFA
jgi:DNA polymerase III subunit delta